MNPSEEQLVLTCLSQDFDPTRIKQIDAGAWPRLVREAIELDVAPLLYGRLMSMEPGVVPAPTMQALKMQYLQTTSRNLRLYSELGRILRSFGQAGLPTIVLKGACLAQVVYRSIGLRPMVDVDLMVHRRDIPRAGELLFSMGYRPDDRNGTEHAERCAHNTFYLAEHNLALEIHWNIEGSPSPFAIVPEEIWSRSRPATIAGVPAAMLSPADLLLHLCIHTSFHHQFGKACLRSLCDIAETIRHFGGEIDWHEVYTRSCAWHARHCVYLTLSLAKTLLGAAVPDPVLYQLEGNDFDARFAVWAEQRIASNMHRNVGLDSDNWGRLYASRRLRDRAGVFLRTCFPSRARLAGMYALASGSWRTGLYYPVRLIDLVRRHGTRAWYLMRHDPATSKWAKRQEARLKESAVRDLVLAVGAEDAAWIEQDPDAAERLAIVQWLAAH